MSTNTNKTIAIVSCKSKKLNYTCSADKMYSASFVFRAQREFFLEAYDDYYIISSKYGIIHHTQIIDPYDVSLYKNPTINFENTEFVTDEEKFWGGVNKQLLWLLSQGYRIDFHSSMDYFKPLPPETKNQINFVKQPKAFGLTQTIYNKATEMVKGGETLDKSISYITQKHPSKYNEQPKWFYHPNFESHFGKTSDLARKYPDYIDEGTLYQLSTFRVNHHKGWVIDESLLPLLYQTDSGQWRLKKNK